MATQRPITYWPPAGEGCGFGPPQLLHGSMLTDKDCAGIGAIFDTAVMERGYIMMLESTEAFAKVSDVRDPTGLFGACEIMKVATMPCLRTLRQRHVAYIL
jgi:hypothetical protein